MTTPNKIHKWNVHLLSLMGLQLLNHIRIREGILNKINKIGVKIAIIRIFISLDKDNKEITHIHILIKEMILIKKYKLYEIL